MVQNLIMLHAYRAYPSISLRVHTPYLPREQPNPEAPSIVCQRVGCNLPVWCSLSPPVVKHGYHM